MREEPLISSQKSLNYNTVLWFYGGGNEPGDQLSPVQVSTAQDRFEILRTVEGQNSRPPDDWLNDRLAGPLSVQLSHRLEQFLDRLLGSGKLDGNH